MTLDDAKFLSTIAEKLKSLDPPVISENEITRIKTIALSMEDRAYSDFEHGIFGSSRINWSEE